jgi:cob(I)alamin adenosyltransferase
MAPNPAGFRQQAAQMMGMMGGGGGGQPAPNAPAGADAGPAPAQPGGGQMAPNPAGFRQQAAQMMGMMGMMGGGGQGAPNAPAGPDPGAGAAAGPAMPGGGGRCCANDNQEGMAAQGRGQQGAKDSPQAEALGTVDELNSFIGLALAQGLSPRLQKALPAIQRELIQLASNLAFTDQEDRRSYQVQEIGARHVARLEDLTDELNEKIEPLGNFILPGGSPGAAHLHVARAVSRRAERSVAALSRQEALGPFILPYLCRLSQALFAMARYENRSRNVPETIVAGAGDRAKGRPAGR